MSQASLKVTKGSSAELRAKSLAANSGSSMVVSLFNNLCLEFKNGNLIQDNCNPNNSLQIFTLATIGNYQSISAPGLSGQCLQDAGSYIITAAECSGAATQQWSVMAAAKGVNIVNRATSKCLNISGNSTSVGGAIISYQCDGGYNEQFAISAVATSPTPTPVPTATPMPTPAPGSGNLVQSLFNQLCLEFKNGNLIQDNCSTSNALQSFVFAAQTGYQTISAPGLNGQCLQDAGSYVITAASCTTAAIQQWSVVNAAKGINIVNRATSRCLNIAGNSTSVGGAIISYQCDGGYNEQFTIGTSSTQPTPQPTPIPTPIPTPNPTPVATPKPTPAPTATPTPTQSTSFSVTSPQAGATLTGTVTVTGIAGSTWVNIAGYDSVSGAKVGADTAPANGQFSMQLSTAALANGSHTINFVAFSVTAGQQGGTSQTVSITWNMSNPVVIPLPTPTPTPVPTPGPTPVTNPPSVLPPPIAGQNFSLSFDDEFTSLSDISANSNPAAGIKWWNGNEQCCMSDTSGNLPAVMYPTSVNGQSVDPYSLIDGGGLKITLQKVNNAWYSGVLTSVDNQGNGFSQQYGYFEIMSKFSGDPGTWPSFWLLNTSQKKGSNSNIGEIDVFESYGYWTDGFCTTLHDWSGGTTPYYNCGIKAPNILDGNFHKIAMLWTATTTTIYYDDVQVATTPTPAVMQGQPYYMLIDQGLGGGWPTDKTPSSSAYQIKYVRVYKQN